MSTASPRARLVDLVPGRSGKAYSGWLKERGEVSRGAVEVATLKLFHGYTNAIDERLEDATAVLDAFHIVKLGTQAVDEPRRRAQQETRGHWGRGKRPAPRHPHHPAVREREPHRPATRSARPGHRRRRTPRRGLRRLALWQQLRAACKAQDPVNGRRIAERLLAGRPQVVGLDGLAVCQSRIVAGLQRFSLPMRRSADGICCRAT